MGEVRVLTERDLRRVVGFGAAELEAIEAVFPLIAAGIGSMPPIMRIDVPEHNGEIDIKSAYLPGYDGIAVKVSTGFFDNAAKGLPSLGGLMFVFDSETGAPTAALFDNGYLTDLRTALAGAVAASHLANPGASSVAIIGAGAQARLQLEALTQVRGIASARVWSRRPDRAASYAAEMSSRIGLPVEAADSPQEAVEGADVLVTTTPATSPVVTADMLHPGLHITAIGSDAESKQELAADVIGAADLVVCDSVAQSRRLGELRAAAEAGVDIESATELGAVIAGSVPGRTSVDAVTVCDLTGTGAQDTAIASLAVRRCREASLGTAVAT